MNVNVGEICGEWDLGYSLDKHTISSTPIGPNEWGHMQFDTVRSEAGEAMFQLKYRSDFSQVPLIAEQMNTTFGRVFASASAIIPMPASRARPRQPVTEITRELARFMGIPCLENLLVKTSETPPMKDISSRDEKVSALMGAFSIYDVLNDGVHDVLIVDDLFDTGASLDAATLLLRRYSKVGRIYVATVTRKR